MRRDRARRARRSVARSNARQDVADARNAAPGPRRRPPALHRRHARQVDQDPRVMAQVHADERGGSGEVDRRHRRGDDCHAGDARRDRREGRRTPSGPRPRDPQVRLGRAAQAGGAPGSSVLRSEPRAGRDLRQPTRLVWQLARRGSRRGHRRGREALPTRVRSRDEDRLREVVGQLAGGWRRRLVRPRERARPRQRRRGRGRRPRGRRRGAGNRAPGAVRQAPAAVRSLPHGPRRSRAPLRAPPRVEGESDGRLDLGRAPGRRTRRRDVDAYRPREDARDHAHAVRKAAS